MVSSVSGNLWWILNLRRPWDRMILGAVLKNRASEVACYLSVLFSKSLSERIVHPDWKTAHVTPIPKSGSRDDPINYRPISLTSIAGEVVEPIMYRYLMHHLDFNAPYVSGRLDHPFKITVSGSKYASFIHCTACEWNNVTVHVFPNTYSAMFIPTLTPSSWNNAV